jgi:hypothetical protein
MLLVAKCKELFQFTFLGGTEARPRLLNMGADERPLIAADFFGIFGKVVRLGGIQR